MKYRTKCLNSAKYQMAFPTRVLIFSNPLNSCFMDGLLECELSVNHSEITCKFGHSLIYALICGGGTSSIDFWRVCDPSNLRLCFRKSKCYLLLKIPYQCFLFRPLCFFSILYCALAFSHQEAQINSPINVTVGILLGTFPSTARCLL